MAPHLLTGTSAKSIVLEPFDTVGDYCLVQFIGRGGMGEVWLGVKSGTMRPVAIKFLHPELAKNERCVESFRREAEIGMQLGGNGAIVAVHDRLAEVLVGDPECPDRLLYLVLDFVDGVSLRRFSDRVYKSMKERLPIRVVVHIVRLMLRAIDAAHTHGIGKNALPVVHGDINPGNVLISSRGEVKLTDFGISHFVPEPTFISRPVGTLPYMAPEQYLGRICPQNDLYSVGAVLHELLTGEPPLAPGGSPQTRERKLLEDPVPSLEREDVPPALERLRRGLLEKNSDLRIQNADEALEMLGTVEQTDCQDEVKSLYLRLFGPPKSRLTKYLQHEGNGAGSFVIDLLRRHSGPRPGVVTVQDAAARTPAHGLASDAYAGDDDDGMPWLDDEDGREGERADAQTEVFRSRVKQVARTVRLEAAIGLAPSVTVAAASTAPEFPGAANGSPAHTLLLEHAGTPPLRITTTAPASEAATPNLVEPEPEPRAGERAGEASSATTTTPWSLPAASRQVRRRYPPRPPYLADGVPFEKRRPNRWRDDGHLDGTPIGQVAARKPGMGSAPPTKQQVAESKGSGGLRPPPSTTLRVRHTHVLALALGIGLLGLGLAALAWSVKGHEPAQAVPDSSVPLETVRAQP